MPLPASYGGVIDVFYKIKALHTAGVKVILHCFQYGSRERKDALRAYCQEVHYYKRLTGMQGFSLLRPYIINSRKNNLLLKNLTKDDAPILFEGLHCCYYLNHPFLKERKKYVRAHNIEHEYYDSLASSATKFWKRWYYKIEASLLKSYEVILYEAEHVFAISEKDYTYFNKEYAAIMLPAFHSNQNVASKLGVGEYCLYHGNLSVAENEEAVLFLIDQVFAKLSFPVIIAGSDPSSLLKEVIEKFDHIKLVANPTTVEMNALVADAHIHALYAAKRSGLKLKLLNALFQGRHVLANEHILESASLQTVGRVANTHQEFVQEITKLQSLEFRDGALEKRKRLLLEEYSNETNAQKIIDIIFPT